MKKTMRKIIASLSAAVILTGGVSSAAFAAPGEAAASDSEAKDDAQTPSGYWTVAGMGAGRSLTKFEMSSYTGWVYSKSHETYYFVKGVKQEEGADVDYFDWVYNAGGFWLEARIEEIPRPMK